MSTNYRECYVFLMLLTMSLDSSITATTLPESDKAQLFRPEHPLQKTSFFNPNNPTNGDLNDWVLITPECDGTDLNDERLGLKGSGHPEQSDVATNEIHQTRVSMMLPENNAHEHLNLLRITTTTESVVDDSTLQKQLDQILPISAGEQPKNVKYVHEKRRRRGR